MLEPIFPIKLPVQQEILLHTIYHQLSNHQLFHFYEDLHRHHQAICHSKIIN